MDAEQRSPNVVMFTPFKDEDDEVSPVLLPLHLFHALLILVRLA